MNKKNSKMNKKNSIKNKKKSKNSFFAMDQGCECIFVQQGLRVFACG